jgi:hypothetical protein
LFAENDRERLEVAFHLTHGSSNRARGRTLGDAEEVECRCRDSDPLAGRALESVRWVRELPKFLMQVGQALDGGVKCMIRSGLRLE